MIIRAVAAAFATGKQRTQILAGAQVDSQRANPVIEQDRKQRLIRAGETG